MLLEPEQLLGALHQGGVLLVERRVIGPQSAQASLPLVHHREPVPSVTDRQLTGVVPRRVV